MDNRKKLQIFVSSTFTDLLNERQAAVEAILKAGHIPAGMELFTASNQSQWEIIKKWIDESDVYMLILGGRYGSIEEQTGKSYTHLEYEYAQSKNKPLFAIVIHDSILDDLPVSSTEKNNPDSLQNFRKKVLSNMSEFFTDTKDIKNAIYASLIQITQEYDLKGWIRGNDNNSNFASEIVKLNEEIRILKQENERLIAQQTERTPELFVDINNSQDLVFSLSTDSSRFYSKIEPILDIPEHLAPYINKDTVREYNQTLQSITHSDIESYNDIQNKISLLLNTKSRKYISIKASNNGNLKANRVYITLSFPDIVYVSKKESVDFDLIEKLDEQASSIIPTQKYHPLKLAEKKYEQDSERKTWGGFGALRPDEYELSPRVLSNSLVMTNKTFDSDLVVNNRITIQLSELMHGLNSIYGNYYIIPLKAGSGYIEIELLCEEYLETKKHRIPITVS